MENASKALLIAASVLIVILVVTVGIKITISADGIKGTAQNTGKVIGDKTADATDIVVGEITGGYGDIKKDESYVGYYADLNGDGKPEGIIYADLAKGTTKSGRVWNTQYSINTVEDVKSYYIIKKNYKGAFGTKDVICSKEEGNARFYIMSLTDISIEKYYWYRNASSDAISGVTSREFGTGIQNTKNMINIWNASDNQNNKDMWGQKQIQDNNIWFVPSEKEWAAFVGELEIIGDKYKERKLKEKYWSSSVVVGSNVCAVDFENQQIGANAVYSDYSVRLSKIF